MVGMLRRTPYLPPRLEKEKRDSWDEAIQRRQDIAAAHVSFIPFSIEAGGVWGPTAQAFFEEAAFYNHYNDDSQSTENILIFHRVLGGLGRFGPLYRRFIFTIDYEGLVFYDEPYSCCPCGSGDCSVPGTHHHFPISY